MIRQVEINEAVHAWGIRHHIVEKDYVLGWLLRGLSDDAQLQAQWIFKGGTCLKKCYLETYRFSEDLDFTLTPEASQDVGEITQMIWAGCERVGQESGIEFPRDLIEFRAAPNPRGSLTIRGKVGYRGPLQPRSIPKIQFDLTTDEAIVRPPILRSVYHPYSDRPPHTARIRCYSVEELLAEKTRALSERTLPRDLYDVVRLFRHQAFSLDSKTVRDTLAQKCAHRGLPMPDLAAIESSPRRAELESEWVNMLGHQLPALPPLESLLGTLADYFEWLNGKPIQPLPSIQENEPGDPTWRLLDYISLPSAWGVTTPVEAIRFAGANRLRIELHYRAKDGRHGVRLVEPYSFRRSRAGHLLFYGRNVNRFRISTYRFDRIVDVKITTQPFVPKWRVEF